MLKQAESLHHNGGGELQVSSIQDGMGVSVMAGGAIVRMIGGGALLGLGAALPIGPVNVEIARRTLRGGFRAGFALGCGAVTIDVIYALLTGISLAPVLNRPALLATLGIVGGAFLAYLGVMSIRAAARQQEIQAGPDGGSSRHYLTGLAMTSLNPMTLLFWFVAVPGAVGKITADPRRDLPLVALGVFLGTFCWVCTFAGLMYLATVGAGHVGKRRWLRAADLAGGLLLLGFAGLTIWRVTRGFLS